MRCATGERIKKTEQIKDYIKVGTALEFLGGDFGPVRGEQLVLA